MSTIPQPSLNQTPTPAASEDAHLVERARRDPQAFGELYERYLTRIYAYIFRRVGNQQDSEDLAAHTFYRAFLKLDSYEDRGLPFVAWLYRIAHNLIANWYRDTKRASLLSLERLWSDAPDVPPNVAHGAPPADEPYGAAVDVQMEARMEAQEEGCALRAAIARLPKDRQQLLRYKFDEDLSNVEAGARMEKSEGAVKSLYFRTLAALRDDLRARGWYRD